MHLIILKHDQLRLLLMMNCEEWQLNLRGSLKGNEVVCVFVSVWADSAYRCAPAKAEPNNSDMNHSDSSRDAARAYSNAF